MANDWPWTPKSGDVAGRTFHSNLEYRVALAEVRWRQFKAEQARAQLTRLLEAHSRAEAAERAAASVRNEAESLLTDLALALGSAH